MGNLFGKSKKKEDRRTDSAPARLEGLESPDTQPAAAPSFDVRPSTGLEPRKLELGNEPVSSSNNSAKPPVPQPAPVPVEAVNPKPNTKGFAPEVPANGNQRQPNASVRGDSAASGQFDQSKTKPPSRQRSSVKDDPSAWPRSVDLQLVVFLFGQSNLDGLTAKAWSDREQSLQSIRTKLMQDYDRTAEDYVHLWKATTSILQKTIRDKVAPVYFTSLEVLRAAVSICTKDLPRESVHDALDNIVPALIHRSGNLNPRISQASISVMCFLACEERVGTMYIIPFVLEPVKAGKNQNTALVGRLELLARLTDRVGLQGDLQASTVLGFALPALETPDDKVRQHAVSLVVDVYMRNGKQLDERYLVKLKPALRKMLQRKIEEADSENMTASMANGMEPTGRGGDLPPLGGSGSHSQGSFKNRNVLALDKEPSGVLGGGSKSKGKKTRMSNEPDTGVYTGYGPKEPAPSRLKTPLVASQAAKYDYTGRVKTPLLKSGDQPNEPRAPKKKSGKPPRKPGNETERDEFFCRDEEDMMSQILEC